MKLINLVVLSVCLLLFGASVNAAPKMVIDETNFNFGYVPQKAKVAHNFWLKSVGDDDLKILKVVPGCGCTKAPLEKKLISPGDSTRLEIIFSTKQYKSLVQKRPKIQTNEGPPDKSVSFKAQVVTDPTATYPLVIKPFIIDFSKGSESQSETYNFSIENVTDQDLNITLIDQPLNMFDIDLPVKIKAGKSAKGIIILNNETHSKKFEKSFTIEVNDANKSRFTIPVKQNSKLANN